MSAEPLLPPLPKADHRFCDPEDEQPDILVWNEKSMHAYARSAQAAAQGMPEEVAAAARSLHAMPGSPLGIVLDWLRSQNLIAKE